MEIIHNNKNDFTAIYALVDPRTPDIIKYVGQSKTPRIRHLQHLCMIAPTTKKSEWLDAISQIGILPQMIILEWVKEKNSCTKEKEYIQKYSSEHLTNFCHNVPQIDLSLNSFETYESDMIKLKLKECNNNKLLVAKLLKISRQTLYNKMKEYNINLN